MADNPKPLNGDTLMQDMMADFLKDAREERQQSKATTDAILHELTGQGSRIENLTSTMMMTVTRFSNGDSNESMSDNLGGQMDGGSDEQ